VSETPRERWWERPFRVFQTNLREIDAGLDVEGVLDHLTGLGANTWLLNTAGIVSFYPSSLPFQHPSPWLRDRPGGDLTAAAVAAAHRRGVRLIARVDLSKVHRDIAEAHPDWCFVDAAGRPQVFNGLHSTCPSGPYYQERAFEILGEVMDRYPVDGFFFNWFNFNQRDYAGRVWGACRCVHCRRRFRGSLTDGAADPGPDWRRYTEETLSEVAGRIRAFIGARSSDTALLLRQDPDVIFHEVNDAVDRPQPLWVESPGEQVRESRTGRPHLPVWVNTVMFLDLPYRFQAEQPGLIGLDLVQTIAHGGNPSAYLVGPPQRLPRHRYEIVGRVLRFHRDHEDLYLGARSAAQVALISSARSEHRPGGPGPAVAPRERRGLHRALTEAHVPFDILPHENLLDAAGDGRLQRYAVLILPDVALLDEAEASALDGYVEAGGGLIATQDTADLDEEGMPLDEIRLRSLGARRVLWRRQGDAVRSAYLRVTRAGDPPGAEEGDLIAIDRTFLDVEPREGAVPSLALIPPSPYGPPEKCYWDVETTHPGLVWHRFGRGRSAYFPWPIGGLYHDLALPEYRALLLRAIDEVSATPRQVVTDAPAAVEVVVGRQPGGRVLAHLINYSGHRGRSFEEPLPIHDLRVEISGIDASRARSINLDRPLQPVDSPGRRGFLLPRLDLFDLVVLE
jgi:hypothetical protein